MRAQKRRKEREEENKISKSENHSPLLALCGRAAAVERVEEDCTQASKRSPTKFEKHSHPSEEIIFNAAFGFFLFADSSSCF